MPVETSSIIFGAANQAAFGTATASPALIFGVEEGDMLPSPQFEDANLTSGSVALTDRDLRRLEQPWSFTTRAYRPLVGMLVANALGSEVDSGSSPNFTHVMELTRPLPWLTIFRRFGLAGTINRVRDAKIQTLRLSWEENGPLMVAVNGVATVFDRPASYTAGANIIGSQDYYSPVGGTFKYSATTGAPATASVKGGFVELVNAAEADFYSGSLPAGGVSDNSFSASMGITVRPDDLTAWNAMVDAAAAGTPFYGSAELNFTSGAHTMKVEAGRVGFVPTEIAATGGGTAWETELGGACYTPSGAAGPVKVTIADNIASHL